jgi:hypothetical protein
MEVRMASCVLASLVAQIPRAAPASTPQNAEPAAPTTIIPVAA